MHLVDPGARGRRAARGLAWLPALLLAVLAAGAAVAASDPGWAGTRPVNLSNGPLDRAGKPDVAASSAGRMAVVWSDQRVESEENNIYALVSDDEGHTWSPTPISIAPTTLSSYRPDVVITGTRAFVVWYDQEEGVAHGGVLITATVREMEIGSGVSSTIPCPVPDAPSNIPARPRLAVGGGRLHAVLNAGRGGGGSHIGHASRALTESVWPTARRVYTSTSALGSWEPALAVGADGSTLYLVWEENREKILFLTGTVSGPDVAWASTPFTVSGEGATPLRPDIAVDSTGNVHVVWAEDVGAEEYQEQYVRYRRYDVSDGSWTTPAVRVDPSPVKVNSTNPTYVTPRLALREEGDQVTMCVTWHGYREGQEAEEVLLSCSADGGESWQAPRNVSRSSTDPLKISILPSLAFDASGRLHVAWEERVGDDIYNDYEIYYARELERKIHLPLVTRNS